MVIIKKKFIKKYYIIKYINIFVICCSVLLFNYNNLLAEWTVIMKNQEGSLYADYGTYKKVRDNVEISTILSYSSPIITEGMEINSVLSTLKFKCNSDQMNNSNLKGYSGNFADGNMIKHVEINNEWIDVHNALQFAPVMEKLCSFSGNKNDINKISKNNTVSVKDHDVRSNINDREIDPKAVVSMMKKSQEISPREADAFMNEAFMQVATGERNYDKAKQILSKKVYDDMNDNNTKIYSTDKLKDYYSNYMLIQDCYEVRKNYTLQYVDINTYNNIKSIMKKYEDKVRLSNKNIVTKNLWNSTQEEYSTSFVSMQMNDNKNNPHDYKKSIQDMCTGSVSAINRLENKNDHDKNF